MLGPVQREWLLRSLRESTATFELVSIDDAVVYRKEIAAHELAAR